MEAGQTSSYGPDRRHASFEASLREAPQSLPRRRPGMTTLFNIIKRLRHGGGRPGRAGARLEPRTVPMQRSSCPAS